VSGPLTHRLLNAVMTVVTLEPVMEGVRHVNALRAQAGQAARGRVQVRLEQLGVATRVDLASLEDELAHASRAARALAEALTALERRLPPDPG
jgi:signal transduction histidine kinase